MYFTINFEVARKYRKNGGRKNWVQNPSELKKGGGKWSSSATTHSKLDLKSRGRFYRFLKLKNHSLIGPTF